MISIRFDWNGRKKWKQYESLKWVGCLIIPDIFASNIVHSTIVSSPLYCLWNALDLLVVMASQAFSVDHYMEFLIRQIHDPVRIVAEKATNH